MRQPCEDRDFRCVQGGTKSPSVAIGENINKSLLSYDRSFPVALYAGASCADNVYTYRRNLCDGITTTPV